MNSSRITHSATSIATARKGMWIAVLLALATVQRAQAVPDDGGATYAAGPNMAVARMGHAAAALPDGRLVLFGGHGSGFNAVMNADFYNPAGNSYSASDMPNIHDGSAIARLADGRYIIAGGAQSSLGIAPGTDTTDIYDPSDDSFTSAGDLAYQRMFSTACILTSGKILIVGGWYDTNSSTYGELGDATASTTFVATGALNVPRALPVVLPTDDGKAIVLGGLNPYGSPGIEVVEQFDPANSSFTTVRSTLFPNETGWITYQFQFQDPTTPKLANGRIVGLAYRTTVGADTEYAIYTFDPATGEVAKLNVNPALPLGSVASLYSPTVNAADGLIYVMGQLAGQSPVQLRLYTIEAGTGLRNDPTGNIPLEPSVNLYNSNQALLADGRIAVTGGTSDGSNYSPITGTFFLTPDLFAPDRRPLGDFDNSGCTDIADFLTLLDNWELDLNGQVVGLPDFLNLLDNWTLGPTCP